ncbi:MAG: AAA family ATPase [Anaerolineales bacterium]|nr:AAA family ATPase [Anaerolineales bacterium]
MLNNPQQGFTTTELDPDLLSTPFEIQTYWYVITGAPCSGKTTLIEQLADAGCRTVPETARLYFEIEMAKGRTIDEVREDGLAVELGLIDMQLRFEGELQADDTAFLDRGLPDSLTFGRVSGLDPNMFLSECFHHRYASVFMLDRLPLQQDDCRIEDEAMTGFLDEWLVRDYVSLGYHVVRVPVLPPKERLVFVLEVVSGRESN